MRVILIAQTVITGDIPGYEYHDWQTSVSGADELSEMAGRLCYLSWDRPNPDTATNKGYLRNIIAKSHFSVLEHSSATLYIDGVSRNFTHELIRHRHLSFSEVSQRYVDVSRFDFVNPPAFEEQSAQFDMEIVLYRYRLEVEALIDEGYKRKEAREAARSILPSGLETKILVTGNLRAWKEMLQKRLSPQADKEFQLVAQKILEELVAIAPNTFQDFE